jgi:hypothetical protein
MEAICFQRFGTSAGSNDSPVAINELRGRAKISLAFAPIWF